MNFAKNKLNKKIIPQVEEREYINFPLGGLWVHTTQDGQEYLSGPLNGFAKINIFPNKNKQGKAPDYFIQLSTSKPKKSAPKPNEDDTPPDGM